MASDVDWPVDGEYSDEFNESESDEQCTVGNKQIKRKNGRNSGQSYNIKKGRQVLKQKI